MKWNQMSFLMDILVILRSPYIRGSYNEATLRRGVPSQWRIQGGCVSPRDQNFLNFIQFWEKSGKFACWRPFLAGWRPSYRESWIRPCFTPWSWNPWPIHDPVTLSTPLRSMALPCSLRSMAMPSSHPDHSRSMSLQCLLTSMPLPCSLGSMALSCSLGSMALASHTDEHPRNDDK